ncbi:MAG TPA: glycoside hydrolase family 43 protein [Burkholderiales bacterium]|nr:glycoside hydrolase family 43 protein [Burkholderiales bacterium]
MRKSVASLVLVLAACATVPEGGWNRASAGYSNPVLDENFPDPAVLRVAHGWYYAYATRSASGERNFNIQVARSRDLIQWEHLGDALPAKPRWAAAKQAFWAPHVIFDSSQNRYFMYYSAEPDDASGKCLGVATADAAAGPFTDSGKPLLCGEGIEHIDPMAFDDPQTGKRLLYWGSGSKPIKVQELAANRMAFLPGSAPRNLIFPDSSQRYRSLVEGAWVIYRHGSYFLFYSGDRCCAREPDYAVMVARAHDPLGPFEEKSEPILEASGAWLAPGHVSIAVDGRERDWLLYHATRAGEQDRKRVMLLDLLLYRDGWPAIADRKPSVISRDTPALRGE